MLEDTNNRDARSKNTTNFRTLAAHLPGDIRVTTDSIHTYKLWVKRRGNWFEKLDKVFKSVVLEWTEDYAPITHLFPFDGYWYFRLRHPTWEQVQAWFLFDYQERINSVMYTQEEDAAVHEIFGWLCAGLDYETTLRKALTMRGRYAPESGTWELAADFCTALRIWKRQATTQEEEREEN